MPEPVTPNPDPGPATTWPLPSANGAVPPVSPGSPVPPIPSEVTEERTHMQRPAVGGFRGVMLPLRRMMHRAPRQP
jgi:hypothetical protein